MRARWISGLIVMGCMTCFGAPAATAQKLDDFSDGDSVGWSLFDNSENQSGAMEVVDGELHLFTRQPIFGTGGAAAVWDHSVVNPAAYVNGTIGTRTHGHDTSSWVAMRVNLNQGNAYLAAIVPSDGSVYLLRLLGGGFSVLESAFVGYQNDEEWYLALTCVDEDLSVKAWPVGDGEPDEPQIQTSDKEVLDPGVVGVYMERPLDVPPPVRLSAYFDDVWFDSADPTCRDIRALTAACNGRGTIKGRVYLHGPEFHRRFVTLSIDHQRQVRALIDGRRTRFEARGLAPGVHTVGFDAPSGCVEFDVQVRCNGQ